MSPGHLAAGSPALERVQQRRHDRYQVEIPGLLRLLETRGGIYAVTVLDVSKTGLRISCPKPFASGTRVEIRCRSTKILGTVKYVREVRNETYLGIEADLPDTTSTAAGTTGAAEIDLLSLFPLDMTRLKRP
jgi:PilZ domain-containing protein